MLSRGPPAAAPWLDYDLRSVHCDAKFEDPALSFFSFEMRRFERLIPEVAPVAAYGNLAAYRPSRIWRCFFLRIRRVALNDVVLVAKVVVTKVSYIVYEF